MTIFLQFLPLIANKSALLSTINLFLLENIWKIGKNCKFRHYMLRNYVNLPTFFYPKNWLVCQCSVTSNVYLSQELFFCKMNWLFSLNRTQLPTLKNARTMTKIPCDLMWIACRKCCQSARDCNSLHIWDNNKSFCMPFCMR